MKYSVISDFPYRPRQRGTRPAKSYRQLFGVWSLVSDGRRHHWSW